jgi:hypothetical protein
MYVCPDQIYLSLDNYNMTAVGLPRTFFVAFIVVFGELHLSLVIDIRHIDIGLGIHTENY